MRTIFSTVLVVFAAIALTATLASAGNGPTFHGDTHQWQRDDDGDGIPNGLDPDWTPPADGTGYGRLGPFIGVGLLGTPQAWAQAQTQTQTQNRNEFRDRVRNGGEIDRADALWIRLRIRDHTCW